VLHHCFTRFTVRQFGATSEGRPAVVNEEENQNSCGSIYNVTAPHLKLSFHGRKPCQTRKS